MVVTITRAVSDKGGPQIKTVSLQEKKVSIALEKNEQFSSMAVDEGKRFR